MTTISITTEYLTIPRILGSIGSGIPGYDFHVASNAIQPAS